MTLRQQVERALDEPTVVAVVGNDTGRLLAERDVPKEPPLDFFDFELGDRLERGARKAMARGRR